MPSQLSVAVGLPAAGFISHEIVKSLGTLSKTGFVVSRMVIFCVRAVALPQSSVNVQVRTIVPVLEHPVKPEVSSTKVVSNTISQLSATFITSPVKVKSVGS